MPQPILPLDKTAELKKNLLVFDFRAKFQQGWEK